MASDVCDRGTKWLRNRQPHLGGTLVCAGKYASQGGYVQLRLVVFRTASTPYRALVYLNLSKPPLWKGLSAFDIRMAGSRQATQGFRLVRVVQAGPSHQGHHDGL